MRMLMRSALPWIAVAVALAAIADAASANVVSLSNQRINAVWTPLTLSASGVTLRCNVTLEGSFEAATHGKGSGTLVGYIRSSAVGLPCTGGTSWFYNGSEVNEVLGRTTLPNSLPWHIVYRGFNGVLPFVSKHLYGIVGFRLLFRATILGISILCVYTTTREQPAPMNFEIGRGGVVTSVIAETESEIASSSGGVCPRKHLGFSNGQLTLVGTGQSIIVTLV